jgi:hypothetical protein
MRVNNTIKILGRPFKASKAFDAKTILLSISDGKG